MSVFVQLCLCGSCALLNDVEWIVFLCVCDCVGLRFNVFAWSGCDLPYAIVWCVFDCLVCLCVFCVCAFCV